MHTKCTKMKSIFSLNINITKPDMQAIRRGEDTRNRIKMKLTRSSVNAKRTARPLQKY